MPRTCWRPLSARARPRTRPRSPRSASCAGTFRWRCGSRAADCSAVWGWTARYLASRLADARRRLANLTAGDLAVSAAFRLSYDQLNDPGRRLFRRLSLVPGDDVGPALAAVLAGRTPTEAEDTLEELADLG